MACIEEKSEVHDRLHAVLAQGIAQQLGDVVSYENHLCRVLARGRAHVDGENLLDRVVTLQALDQTASDVARRARHGDAGGQSLRFKRHELASYSSRSTP